MGRQGKIDKNACARTQNIEVKNTEMKIETKANEKKERRRRQVIINIINTMIVIMTTVRIKCDRKYIDIIELLRHFDCSNRQRKTQTIFKRNKINIFVCYVLCVRQAQNGIKIYFFVAPVTQNRENQQTEKKNVQNARWSDGKLTIDRIK